MTASYGGNGLKRLLDLLVASLALLGASPLTLVVAGLIYLEDRGPILFTQKRVGQGLREFRILKFRSMRLHQLPVDEVGQVSGDHPLVTRVGRVIRRLKIDELPQLLNVLAGDLSLVGPRPTVMEQLEQYDEYQKRRLLVKPGLTGWAQVNGNVALSWDERIALDVWYVDNWSFGLDCRILLATVLVIILGEQPNARTLEEALQHAQCHYRRG